MGSFQDKLDELGPGKQLAAMPIDAMITRFGAGIANAQKEMDRNAIATAVRLGEERLELPHPEDPSLTVTRSLLSLGFMPSFYQFTEATFEMRIDMKWQVEQSQKLGVDGNLKLEKGPVAVGVNVNVEDGRKFNLDASLMVNLKLSVVAVPPPQAFMEYVRRSLAE